MIFERLKLPQQIIYRRKGNLSESPNHLKYREEISVLRKHLRILRNTLLLLSSRNLNISRNKLYIWNLRITRFKMIYDVCVLRV